MNMAKAGHYTTTVAQESGQSWTNLIWRLNGSGSAVAPSAGNTYELISNGTAYGNNQGNTRVRNPLIRGLLPFPGDSLKLNHNTEIELKRVSAGSPPTAHFPGVGGNPGLILNGGSITVDDDEIFTLTGRVSVVSTAYIATGEDGGGALRPNRALNLAADLSGTGDLVWFQGGTSRPQQISGNNAGYSGTWILKAGWLQAGRVSSMSANSVLVDPRHALPFPTVVNITSLAAFDPITDVSTTGSLRLTNGGFLVLHQNCAFDSVAIEGVPLAPGRHSYADLVMAFPTNIISESSGSITVQTMGGLPPVVPGMLSQPVGGNYEVGATIVLSASATGTLPLGYRWERKQGGSFVAMSDGGIASGTGTRTLVLTGVQTSDSTEYRVVVSNAAGSRASQAAAIQVFVPMPPAITTITPPTGSILTSLNQLQVSFNKLVTGVEAEDLIINGTHAVSLSGSGSNYTFGFSQPLPGNVSVAWDVDSAITDADGKLFDPSASWEYVLRDGTAPVLTSVSPARGAVVTGFSECEILFSEPVQGVEAEDLLANGSPALSVTGGGAGPYVFRYDPVTNSSLTFAWAATHGITDLHTNAFADPGWIVQVNSADLSYKNIRINEILCATASTNALSDEDGDQGDWIELRNTGATTVNLAGWALTDDASSPGKWTLPLTNLGPGQFLVVFASGKDRREAGARLHTSFRLSSGGGYVGLFQANRPPIAVDEINYPGQRNDISYGLDPAQELKYFAQPTPGFANGSSTLHGIVEDIRMSVEAGFFTQQFNLVLVSPTPGAVIVYTTNGSVPSLSGSATNGRASIGPVPIDRTTALRAAAFSTDLLPSKVASRTFIFVEDVIRQPKAPEGYPVGDVWTPTPGAGQAGARAHYEMSPAVVTNPVYAARVRQGLVSIPTLSLQLPIPDLFDPVRGMYTHPQERGPAWERACSMELIYPEAPGIQIDSSLQIQGGTQREPGKNPKHSLRVNFKGEYGPAKLEFPIFPESPVARFDRLVLDGGINMWWHYVGGSSPADQRFRAQGVRDQFTSDLMNAIGHPSYHGKFFNVYLNGLYWGLHYVHEMPDESFAAENFGGEPEDYDVIRNTTTMAVQVLSGDLQAWNKVLSLSNPGLADNAQYSELQQWVDLENFIDYMIVNHWTANEDWPHHNWYVSRRRAPGEGFKFMIWDAEHTLKNVNDTSKFGLTNAGTPAQILTALTNNAEFRLRFADHVQKHFFNGGVFYTDPSPANATWDPTRPERNIPASYYMRRIAEIDTAIVAESARWGGYTTTQYTRDEHWLRELHNLLGYTNTSGNTANFFPLRSGVVLNKYRAMGLWPSVLAPVFSRHGGMVEPFFQLTMTNRNAGGTIYYTTNGLDPRLPGSGAVAAWAMAYTNGSPLVLIGPPLAPNPTALIKARVLGSAWSPLAEAQFTVGNLSVPISITEIMYNPPGGGAYEFIEIYNFGAAAIDLEGWRLEGVTYTFPSGSVIPAKGIWVLASGSNPSAFAARYPGVNVVGYFSGSLANEGERLALRNSADQIVLSVDYDNGGGWPAAADGQGSSLQIVNVMGDPDAPANWTASAQINGTPGYNPAATPPPVVRFCEIMAENNGWVPNGGTFPDWFELQNRTDAEVSLAGWSVSDGSNPRKYVFPAQAILPARGYLVVWCDTNNAAPGLHSGFALAASGESLFLYDANTNRVDAVTYGQQLGGYSIARSDLGDSWGLADPSPGTLTTAGPYALPDSLVVNEWLANPFPGQSDWFELYNASTAPAALRGLSVTTSNGVFRIEKLAFLEPKGFLRIWADELPGDFHVDLKLKAQGDFIQLRDTAGRVINEVRFGAQAEGVSQGRLPDGATQVTSFPGTSSPGAPNYVDAASGPMLNEIMARNGGMVMAPDGSAPDWVEIYNPLATPMDISGMFLAPGPGSSRAWSFPSGLTLPGNGYLVVWLDSSKPASGENGPMLNAGFNLDGGGDRLFLLHTNRQTIDSVTFGPQIQNLTIGRADSSEWALLTNATPGAANAAAHALAGPAQLALNEWMAEDPNGNDWFELYNNASLPVALSGLYITDDPSAFGATNFAIPALSYIGSRGHALFVADSDPEDGPDHAPFRLDQHAGMLRLCDPQGAVLDNIDYALQLPGVSEGRLPDGAAAIVQFPQSPTPGGENRLPPPDTDSDGLPDDWEQVHGLNRQVSDGDDGASGDPDQDGLTNREEFLAGTHPRDAASRLHIESAGLTSQGIELRFPAAANRTYTVQYCDDLSTGAWLKLANIAARPEASEIVVLDPTGVVPRYYRLVTPAQD